MHIYNATQYMPQMIFHNDDGANVHGAYINIRKSRGGAAISANDHLGTVVFQGKATSGTFRNGAFLFSQCEAVLADGISANISLYTVNSSGVGGYRLTASGNGDIKIPADNAKLLFGTGNDFGIYYDGTNANIDTDLVAPSDLTIDCGTAKTLVLEVPVYNDIQFNIESGRVASANFPDWDSTFTTNTGSYKFDVDDYIDIGTQEMLHNWKEASDIYFHIHTALDGANASGSSQYAKFIIYIAYADEGGVYTETNKDIEIEIPTGTADLTHLFGQATALAMAGLTIGTQMNLRVKRIAATTGTEYPNHIFVTQVGLHYQIDTLGSRQIGTK
jgi:hypothetical protein